MCGIFGIASTKPPSGSLEKHTDTLLHRGPDDCGYYRDEAIHLGHRRLSIIDLETGKQPIFNEDRSKCIIYNGEIYNHLELRGKLIAKGHRFSTRTDTEAILHAYEEFGQNCVEHLRGMFAFAVWDSEKKELFLARDRLGIKPLFYAENSGCFYFASEMKAILADSSFPRDIDAEAMASYFTLSYIPAPWTIYGRIRKLLPGHTLTWKSGDIKSRKYWDVHFVPDSGKSEDDFVREYMGILRESIGIRLMSDVPLGAFLSGGIDSSTVVALMGSASDDAVNTFCIGFGGSTGGYLDERGYAREVAQRYRTNHREYEVWPEPAGIVEKIVRAFDEPFADDATIPSYYVCRSAREGVTVALSGLGGDEAFAGYERHLGFQIQRVYRRIPYAMRRRVIPGIVGRIPERKDGHYTVNHMKRFARSGHLSSDVAYFSYLSIMDADHRDSLFTDTSRYRSHQNSCKDLVLSHFNSENVDGEPDSLNRALYCDLKTYLPEDILAATDRMSMQHSLEVRVPFVDHHLVECCAGIPPGLKLKRYQKKHMLIEGVRDILPASVINHRKQGFVGPMTQWLKNELKQYATDTLSAENLKRHDLLNPGAVREVLGEHFSGREIHDTLIWSLVVFQKWYDIYIEGNAPSDQRV